MGGRLPEFNQQALATLATNYKNESVTTRCRIAGKRLTRLSMEIAELKHVVVIVVISLLLYNYSAVRFSDKYNIEINLKYYNALNYYSAKASFYAIIVYNFLSWHNIPRWSHVTLNRACQTCRFNAFDYVKKFTAYVYTTDRAEEKRTQNKLNTTRK